MKKLTKIQMLELKLGLREIQANNLVFQIKKMLRVMRKISKLGQTVHGPSEEAKLVEPFLRKLKR